MWDVLKVIKGGSLHLLNQMHHSSLKNKKENFKNVSRIEGNIKHLVL